MLVKMSSTESTESTESLHVVTTIPAGTRPAGVAVDVHDRVFVTNSGDNTVLVIDARTNTASASVPVGLRPESVATDPQFGVFVANGGIGTVSAIDRFNTVVGTVNVGGPPPVFEPAKRVACVAVDHLLGRAYVTSRIRHRVAVIGTGGQLPEVAHHFIDVKGPLGIAVDPESHRLYVAQPESDTVSVIDPATEEIIATVPVGPHPLGMAVDPQHHRVYVANSGFRTISAIDSTTGTATEIDVGTGPTGVAVGPRGDVFVTHTDGTVKVIDAGTGGVSVTVPVGHLPEGVAFEPHSECVYVANRADSTVSVIDLGHQ
jgi:YVTN family beta-propeller protein